MKSGISTYFIKTFLFVCLTMNFVTVKGQNRSFDFYGDTFNFTADSSLLLSVSTVASSASVHQFYDRISASNYKELVSVIKSYQDQHHLNDWIYYQLIRKVAEQISPKADNYFRYTLYKWFLLNKCGYDARLAVGNEQVIFMFGMMKTSAIFLFS